MALLAFGTLGIVFGDIGTSPIYAFRETFHHADLEVTQATAFGAASVAFCWAVEFFQLTGVPAALSP